MPDPSGPSPDPSAGGSPQPCSMRLLAGYRFLPMGATPFGVVIDNPRASLPSLPGTHLYFPVECAIDPHENAQFGLIRVSDPGGGPSPCVVAREDGTPCHPLRPGVFDGPLWDALRADANVCLRSFGIRLPLTADAMYARLVADLIAELGASQAEIDAGRWWLTPPMTTTGLQAAFFLLDGAGNRQGDPIQPLVRAPIAHARLVPGPAASANVRQYEKLEVELLLDNDYFHHDDRLSPGARFDACDADHDGERIAVDARFTLRDADDPGAVVSVDGIAQAFDVPCFCMKDAPAGPFRWKARFAPPQTTAGARYWEMTSRAVVWHVARGDTPTNIDGFNRLAVPGAAGDLTAYYHYWGYNDFTDPQAPQALAAPGNHRHASGPGQADDPVLPIPTIRFRVDPGLKDGPLQVNPAGGFYLQQLAQATGYRPRPFFVAGAVMPWAYSTGPTSLDRGDDLLAPMAAAGMNFNYTWMAPWETLLTRAARTEDWYTGPPDPAYPAGPTLRPVPVGDDQGWRPWSYYDQGRADRLDRIIEAHESNDVYNAVVIWPHDTLHVPGGFADDNGLSQVPGMTFDDFFACAGDDADERWLWQKNLYRYLVARYGYSRTLAAWFVVAELEGVGPGRYSGEATEYWWTPAAAPQVRRWHDKVLQTLRALDCRRRPVSSYACQFRDNPADPYGAREIPDHGDFQGYDQKIDLVGFDAYPVVWPQDPPGPFNWVNDADGYQARGGAWIPDWATWCRTALAGGQQLIWHYGVARMVTWARNTAALPQPHLVTEFGMLERRDTLNDPAIENQVRSYLHFCLWAAFAAGHAGTPLKWCDQGQFGALFPHGAGAFKAGAYPDWSAEYRSLIRLVSPAGPLGDFGRLTTRLALPADMTCTAATVRAFGLRSDDSDLIVVWVFDDDVTNSAGRSYEWTDGNDVRNPKNSAPDARADDTLTIPNVPPGAYVVTRYNTWDVAAPTSDPARAPANGALLVALGVFPTCTEAGRACRVWDGADFLLIVRRR